MPIKVNKLLSPQKHFTYKATGYISIESLNSLLNFVQGVINSGWANIIPVDMFFNEVIFQDKLTYVLIECIVYYLSTKIKSPIKFKAKYKSGINIADIEHSPLKYLNGSNNFDFRKKFYNQLNYYHFRKVIKQENNFDKAECSLVMQDIDSFLKGYQIEPTYRNDISEVVAELIDNALDHGNTDCLLDFGIVGGYRKRVIKNGVETLSEETYYGVNIVIINFSNQLIGDGLKNRIESYDCMDLPRYQVVTKAKEIHSKQWSHEYSEDDFYVLSSFQHKISGRSSSGKTGGTGLTKLLKSLEERSDSYNCYVLSGNRILNFEHDLLGFDENNWIGFNNEKDYVNYIPDNRCFKKSKFYMPGTAYNLNFVLSRDKEEP